MTESVSTAQKGPGRIMAYPLLGTTKVIDLYSYAIYFFELMKQETPELVEVDSYVAPKDREVQLLEDTNDRECGICLQEFDFENEVIYGLFCENTKHRLAHITHKDCLLNNTQDFDHLQKSCPFDKRKAHHGPTSENLKMFAKAVKIPIEQLRTLGKANGFDKLKVLVEHQDMVLYFLENNIFTIQTLFNLELTALESLRHNAYQVLRDEKDVEEFMKLEEAELKVLYDHADLIKILLSKGLSLKEAIHANLEWFVLERYKARQFRVIRTKEDLTAFLDRSKTSTAMQQHILLNAKLFNKAFKKGVSVHQFLTLGIEERAQFLEHGWQIISKLKKPEQLGSLVEHYMKPRSFITRMFDRLAL